MPFFNPFIIFLGLFGVIYLLSPFGILYALPVFTLSVASIILWKRGYTRVAFGAISASFLGSWTSFASWILSRRSIDPSEATHTWGLDLPSIATAGFPVRALELPQPPLGSGMIPNEMILNTFANHAFWFGIALIISALLAYLAPKQVIRYQFSIVLGVLGIIGLLYNFTLFMLWFD